MARSGLLRWWFQLDGPLTGWEDGYGSAATMSGSPTNPGGGYPIITEDGLLCLLSDGAGSLLREGLFTGDPDLWVGFAHPLMSPGFLWLRERSTTVTDFMALTASISRIST